MIDTNQDSTCSCAKAVEFEGETVYECSDPGCPCFGSLCNVDICCPDDDKCINDREDDSYNEIWYQDDGRSLVDD